MFKQSTAFVSCDFSELFELVEVPHAPNNEPFLPHSEYFELVRDE